MNRIALTLALAAGIACAAFGYEPQRHNDTFTTNGVTYAQRGGLGVADYVVTNIDASAVGKVQSVNGKTGDVVLNAQDVGALPITGGTMTGQLNADTIAFGIHTIRDSTGAVSIYNTLTKTLLVIPEAIQRIDYLALLSDVAAAIEQIAPAFTSKAYALDELCSYNGVVYRCKSAYSATESSPNPNYDRTHWEAKTVSELFARLSDIAAAQSAIAAAAQSATNYTDSAVNAVEQTVPNNITRTANSATLVHADGGSTTNLITIRQASSSLAGLMTAADKVKLDSVGNYAAVSNRAMSALQSFTETDPTVPAWAKSPSKPSYSAAEVGAVSLGGGRMNTGAMLSFGVAGNGLDINSGGVEISDTDDGRTESLYIDYNSITHTSPNGNEQLLVFPLEASDFDAYTKGEVDAISATIPNNITRTATDATLVHADGGSTTNLITIRQASETLAGLMTAADKVKLDSVGNYATVSNRAMSALQSFTETDPTVPSWAKAASKPTYTADEVGAVSSNKIEEVRQDNAQTRQIVTTWENFLDGSNVVFSITNYLSGTYSLDAAKMTIKELREGEYREVYNSRDEILLHIQDFKDNDFKNATNQVIGAVNAAIDGKADKAWGKYSSDGQNLQDVSISNTVYMTAPNTVFAGGLEYERVAVGQGAVCVLTTRGAPVWTQGDEGTFKFQDDGGTNYFGFAKTDSYTIGANTDGITVNSGIVTLTYNITMSGRPCVWYKASLSDNTPWEQLNLPDGSPVAGASHAVTWEQNPPAGTQVCYINVGNQPSGFFKATVEVAGEAKFMTNMKADLNGGIICPNTATGINGVIKPSYNGSTVIWTWSAN